MANNPNSLAAALGRQSRGGGAEGNAADFLRAIAARLAHPVSDILAHLRGLKDLPPELARINMVRFEASIATGGAVTQPDSIRLHPEYASEIFGMILYEQDPANDHDLAPHVTFNTREDGRGFDLFDSSWSMGIIPTTGTTGVLTWPRGLYRVSKGATLSTTFATSSSYSGAGSAKKWGVLYLLNQAREGL